jgi:hypothetical protein
MSWSHKSSASIPRCKLVLVVTATAALLTSSGCGNFLERHAPDRDGYIARYFEFFDGSQIQKLDYAYKGAIGGDFTVGRAEFKGRVQLKDLMIQAKIKGGLVAAGMYDPAKMMKEPAAAEFRQRWEVHAGGTMPAWFDFPFDRKMRTLREASEGSNSSPRYENIWYIDDEHNIVYVRGNRG